MKISGASVVAEPLPRLQSRAPAWRARRRRGSETARGIRRTWSRPARPASAGASAPRRGPGRRRASVATAGRARCAGTTLAAFGRRRCERRESIVEGMGQSRRMRVERSRALHCARAGQSTCVQLSSSNASPRRAHRGAGGGHHPGASLCPRAARPQHARGRRSGHVAADGAESLVLRAPGAALHDASSFVDSAGVAISLGAVAAVQGDAMGVTAPVTGAMTAGRYTVVWRTAAADGHATIGQISLCRDASPPDRDGAVVPGRPRHLGASRLRRLASFRTPSSTPSYYAGFSPALRWAELVALLTLIGVIVFRLFVLRDAALSAGRRRRRDRSRATPGERGAPAVRHRDAVAPRGAVRPHSDGVARRDSPRCSRSFATRAGAMVGCRRRRRRRRGDRPAGRLGTRSPDGSSRRSASSRSASARRSPDTPRRRCQHAALAIAVDVAHVLERRRLARRPRDRGDVRPSSHAKARRASSAASRRVASSFARITARRFSA